MTAARIALVGSGSIANAYCGSIASEGWGEVVCLCNASQRKPRELLVSSKLPVVTLDELCARRDIDLVLNLTPAAQHERLNRSCLAAGLCVYSEKPVALTRGAALDLCDIAKSANCFIASAPAIPIQPPLQAVRALVGRGDFGDLIGATGTLLYPGPEVFHPNPADLYTASAGPLWDMGIYYIAALTAILGPVKEVVASASRARSLRQVMVGSLAGSDFAVDTDTHWLIHLRHMSGIHSNLTVSFDGVAFEPAVLDFHGTSQAVRMISPNTPSAKVELKDQTGAIAPVLSQEISSSGHEDFAAGPRFSLEQWRRGEALTLGPDSFLHVTEILEGITQSAQQGARIEISDARSFNWYAI